MLLSFPIPRKVAHLVNNIQVERMKRVGFALFFRFTAFALELMSLVLYRLMLGSKLSQNVRLQVVKLGWGADTASQ